MASIDNILRVAFEEVEEAAPPAPSAARYRSLAASGACRDTGPTPPASNILEVDFWSALNVGLSRLKSRETQLESSEGLLEGEVVLAADTPSGTITLPALVVQTLSGSGKVFRDISLVVDGPPVLTTDGRLCVYLGLAGDPQAIKEGGSVPEKVVVELLLAGEVIGSQRLEHPDVQRLIFHLPESLKAKLPALGGKSAAEGAGLRLPISACQFRLLIE